MSFIGKNNKKNVNIKKTTKKINQKESQKISSKQLFAEKLCEILLNSQAKDWIEYNGWVHLIIRQKDMKIFPENIKQNCLKQFDLTLLLNCLSKKIKIQAFIGSMFDENKLNEIINKDEKNKDKTKNELEPQDIKPILSINIIKEIFNQKIRPYLEKKGENNIVKPLPKKTPKGMQTTRCLIL
jgi:hypothetical protein